DRIDFACPEFLRKAAEKVWDECVDSGRTYGYRNAQATVLAPTGTIAFMMDCDTTGIEPDIALVKYKQLAGGGMLKIVNRTVPMALSRLGYDDAAVQRIVKHIEDKDTIEGAADIKAEHLPVFDCAFKAAQGTRSIAWKAHITMMAAAQPFLSGAISKTVNMPADSTVEDVEKAYIEGWKLGLKALAIYRDGSKQSQPLNTTKDSDKKKGAMVGGPQRRRLPATRQSITHKFSVGGHEGYITVGMFEDGAPGELFISMAKEGSTIGGLMDVIGTETSMCLQYGVPLQVLVDKFSHMRFEPAGWTGNPDIPNAKSVVDYIFRWMGMQFISGYRDANAPKRMLLSKDDDGGDEVAEGHSKAAVAPQTEPATTADNARLPSAIKQRMQTSLKVIAAAHHGDAALTAEEQGNLRSAQFAKFQSDAPSCDNCGSITVRNGNCYLCHNCGNSLGCS
ncbi:MAG: vitamin B12-dependent ribonucleotide reductase, partial [Planctomycetaceae bacterium]|nr:vitamin B12-dependent ribonucleotide reductase [Planctomycetaceae bacterium]